MKVFSINVGNPIVPKNAKDPAAQFGNLRKANKQLVKRYKNIKKGMRELISGLDKRVISTNSIVISGKIITNVKYEYLIDVQKYNEIDLFIQQLLNEELLDNQAGVFTRSWWLNANLSQAYEDATEDIINSAHAITPPSVGLELYNEVQSITPESRFFSRGFQERLALIHSRVFNEMSGLTDSTKVDLAETLARGMSDGIGVQQLSKNVASRVDVSYSRAKRIVRTEVMGAFRTATSSETDALNAEVYDDSPWGMASLWFSALAPTSRSWHISRHGKLYTTDEIRAFYATGANAIQCLCSQSAVLQNKKTGEVLQEKLLDRMEKQKEAYQASHGLVKKAS